jgi:spore coat polysaccharide biosynthesis protein SpsF
MPTIAIVLQARMGSRRLPGKVLEAIGPRTILGHCIHRLRLSQLPVIVATSDRADDDAVEHEARRHGAEVFRGSEDDVLSRYLGAARAFHLTDLIRATADNPFVDTDASARVLQFRRRVGADHVVECGLPVGTAVEAVSVEALERTRDLVTDAYDREHVTSFLRRDSRFRALRAVAPGHVRRPGLRLTVDTAEDLAFARDVFERLDGSTPAHALVDVIRAADALLVRAVARSRIKQGA